MAELPNRHYAFYQGRRPGQLNASDPYDAARERCVESDSPRERLKLHVPCMKSDLLEDGLSHLCRLYGVSCVSQRDALLEGFLRMRDGFHIEDIAGDCQSLTPGLPACTPLPLHSVHFSFLN